MNTDKLQELIHSSHEFLSTIKEARSDGKIRFFEGVKIAKEFGSVIKLVPNLKKSYRDFIKATNEELTEIARGISSEATHINKQMNHEDITDILICVQSIVRIIERNKN